MIGGVEVGKALVSLPVDLIIFTGSSEKGKKIAASAAENLVPCILELGGKCPAIVDKGANLENAALRICQGKFENSGQTCVAPDYLLVHKDVKAQLVEKIRKKTLIFFGVVSKNSDWVRIISQDNVKRIERLMTNHKGKILYGGKIDWNNKIVEPTLIEDPDLNSDLMQEEIFGPILPIREFDDFSEVLKIINEKPKALAIYYFGPILSKNKELMLKQTSSGALLFNEACLQILNPELPYGGVQNSGMKYLHGKWGFMSCSHYKSIFDSFPLNTFPMSARFPPFSNQKQSILKFLLKSQSIFQEPILSTLFKFTFIVFVLLLFRKGYFEPIFQIIDLLLYYLFWYIKFY